MTVYLKHESGFVKEAPVGFSWTMLFFGAFPCLFRKDFKYFFITIGTNLLIFFVVALIDPTLAFGNIAMLGSWIVWATVYNKLYIEGLLMKGFTPADELSQLVLERQGLIASKPK